MLQVYSNVIQYQGNHYDYGCMKGKQLKGSPILHVIHQFAPSIWDEILGLSDALEMNREAAIREFGGYYLKYGRSGCPISTRPDYLIRNYDPILFIEITPHDFFT